MEFVHKADSHRCCVKGCARAAICPIPNGYIGELLQFGNHKHHILCGAHHRAVLRAMKVFSLPPLSPFYSSHIYLQSKEHHHEHASAHHEDAMEVDSHDSEQSHAHPLKPFGDLKGHQQWTRVNRFAGSVWETIVNAAMDIMHCEFFDLKRIEFTVDGQDYAIAFSHERHSVSHLSTLSEEERSQIFMVSKKLTGQTRRKQTNPISRSRLSKLLTPPPDLGEHTGPWPVFRWGWSEITCWTRLGRPRMKP